MAVTALIVYLVAMGLAFGWRTFAHWRRTGDSGLRLNAGPAGSIAWWAKTAFVAAIMLGLAGPLAAITGLAPLAVLDSPLAAAAGVVIAIGGTVATLAAQLAMGASWRIGVDAGERTDLVTGGPFALARNPIFTAMVTTSAGLTLMVPNPVALLALVVLVAAIELQVRAVEEPYLLAAHGRAYQRYASQVGRFVPGLGRLPGPDTIARAGGSPPARGH
ncbi:isoprenylcysteine carboxylmethyltransferase family protein [Planomonospora sp. ID91781]|uniref:methyltransferase family protein n=1 Tax=Planomonospora sp. ID91781 TaxID=2738135 RepID=UPI0018C384EA|nr:isoprenylcysteine carboxylmethyltransferase family protein [Planomonospora sp. ID91781]MBG0823292.1 isoprenylcysteine carboxylmethyltransferase family protein [Planomonospora sp. ID91781]